MARLLRLVRPLLLGARRGARPGDSGDRRLSARNLRPDRRRPLWRGGGARSGKLPPTPSPAQGRTAPHRTIGDAAVDAGGRSRTRRGGGGGGLVCFTRQAT